MTEEKGPDINNPEVLLVAGALLKPALASEAAQYVETDDFEDPRLRLIWTAITGMLDEGLKPDSIDPVGVGKRCGDTHESQMRVARYADSLVDSMPRMSSLVMSAHRVRRRATMRLALEKMRTIATNLKFQINGDDGDAPDLDEELVGLSVAVASRSDKEKRRTTFKDLAPQVQAYFDKISTNDNSTYIPTGIPRLDDFLGGGLRPGQLHVVLGATGAGKTAFASQICDHAVEKGKRALMFSMEVDPLDIYIRDIERKAGRSRWDLKYAHKRDDAMTDLMKAHSVSLTTKNKVVYGEPISVEGIRQAILTESLRTGPIDLIVVDHAQVALPSKTDKKSMPRYLEVKSTAEGLRALGRQLGVAVVLTAQMNPVQKDEKPSMSMVRESKDINNAAEVVLMIYHVKGDFNGETLITESWLCLEKVRAGREGRIRMQYDGSMFRFAELYQGSE